MPVGGSATCIEVGSPARCRRYQGDAAVGWDHGDGIMQVGRSTVRVTTSRAFVFVCGVGGNILRMQA